MYGLPDRKPCESLLKHNQQYYHHLLLVTMYLSYEVEQIQLSG